MPSNKFELPDQIKRKKGRFIARGRRQVNKMLVDRFNEINETKRLTRKDLADIANKNKSLITHAMSNNSNLTVDTISCLAMAMGGTFEIRFVKSDLVDD